MKSSIALFLALGQALAQTPIRVITFNIRYDNTDISLGSGEVYWLNAACAEEPALCRAPGVVNTLHDATVEAASAGAETLIGLQECLDNQLGNIVDSLAAWSPGWTHIGVGRDDGVAAGEYAPILYNTNAWTLVHDETKWLSETPDVPSKSWDSGSNRIVTVGVFDHVATGRRVLHANVHLDNANAVARANQIGVAVDVIRAVDAAYGGPGLPTILTGDFNSGDTDPAYTTLVAENWVKDSYTLTDNRSERFFTFTGFLNEYSSRIDYIWVADGTNNPVDVTAYSVLDNLYQNSVMISDHRPVVADMTLS